MQVLLIEDSDTYTELVTIWLARAFPTLVLRAVTTLQAGLQALAEAQDFFAVVLLDLTLPDAAQFMAIPKIYEVTAQQRIPIIVMSGTPAWMIPDPLRAQYTRYVEKDGLPDALVLAIQELEIHE